MSSYQLLQFVVFSLLFVVISLLFVVDFSDPIFRLPLGVG